MSNPELERARELLEKVSSGYESTLVLAQTYVAVAAVEAQEQANALLERQAIAMESIAATLSAVGGSMREYVLPNGSQVLAFHAYDIGRKKVVIESGRLPAAVRGTLEAAIHSLYDENYDNEKIAGLIVEAKEWLDSVR